MNQANFQQIVNHYIDSFEYTNGAKHQEYYKWRIAKRFRPMMDAALDATDAELPSKLYAVKKLSSNLIDSYTQPFHGLCKYAEREPETVRAMFRALYGDNGASTQDRVDRFLDQSLELLARYYPDSFLYRDDMHSVTGYLFFYDPDTYYLYKASHARIFADCIEFYDDWGYGNNTKLDVYYRMCDEVIEAINLNAPLLNTAASRFEIDPEGMHPDTNKHILLFDIIYCCSTYNLFKGIHFVVPKNNERRLMQERKEKAIRLSEALDAARQRLAPLEEGKRLLSEVIVPGARVRHRVFGEGVIESVSETAMTISFPQGGERKLGIAVSILNGIVSVEDPGFIETVKPYGECLLHEKTLRDAVSYAERQLAPYADYLD